MAAPKEWTPPRKKWELPDISLESEYRTGAGPGSLDEHIVTVRTPDGLEFTAIQRIEPKDRAVRPHQEGTLQFLAQMDWAVSRPDIWDKFYRAEAWYRPSPTYGLKKDEEAHAFLDVANALGKGRLYPMTDMVDQEYRTAKETRKRPSDIAEEKFLDWFGEMTRRKRE
jgi:hypothetical protein